MKINTISLIEKLKTIIFPDGFELSVCHGLLNSTKAIYLKDVIHTIVSSVSGIATIKAIENLQRHVEMKMLLQ